VSSREERHPLAQPQVEPMGSSSDYQGDVDRGKLLRPLVNEGHASSLAELALRFAISHPAISTALVGFSDLDQIEQAAAAVEKGSLPAATLDRIGELLGSRP
jgi:aryl-alcohol dehydrogenase-like predicted oxidoreductase